MLGFSISARQIAACAAMALSASSSWASVPFDTYIPNIPWNVEAKVTSLADGRYQYDYEVTPVKPDYTHLLNTFTLHVANVQSISDVHIDTEFWTQGAYRFIDASGGLTSSGPARLQFSGTESFTMVSDYFSQYWHNQPLTPQKGLSISFTSTDAPGQAAFSAALSGYKLNLDFETQYGSSHLVVGQALSPVPEPAGWALALSGLVAAGMVRGRRRVQR